MPNNGAKAGVNPSGGQNDVNAKILETLNNSGSATEDKAEVTMDEQTNLMDEQTNLMDGKGANERTVSRWDDESSKALGRFTNAVKAKSDNDDEFIPELRKTIWKKSRIVAYCSRTNEKIDFKKVNTFDKDDNGKAKSGTYHFEVVMTKPSRPNAVIIKYPKAEVQQLKTLISNRRLGANEQRPVIDKATASALTADEGSAYGLTVLQFSRSCNDLFDWLSKNTPNTSIMEDTHIVGNTNDAYYKGRAAGDIYENVEEYTRGRKDKSETPSLYCVARLTTNPATKSEKAKTDNGILTTNYLNLIGKFDTLTIQYNNTGRPMMCNKFNTIYAKKHVTTKVADITKQIYQDKDNMTHSYTEQDAAFAYFSRFFDANGVIKPAAQLKTETKNVTLPYSQDKNGINVDTKKIGDEVMFTSSAFKNEAAELATLTVDDWYGVQPINDGKKTGKKLQIPVDGNLVQKEIYFARGGKKSVRNMTTDTDASNFDKRVSKQIKEAVGETGLTYDVWSKALSKTNTRSTSNRATSTGTLSFTVNGVNFEELQALVAENLSSQTNEPGFSF